MTLISSKFYLVPRILWNLSFFCLLLSHLLFIHILFSTTMQIYKKTLIHCKRYTFDNEKHKISLIDWLDFRLNILVNEIPQATHQETTASLAYWVNTICIHFSHSHINNTFDLERFSDALQYLVSIWLSNIASLAWLCVMHLVYFTSPRNWGKEPKSEHIYIFYNNLSVLC